MGYCLHIDTSGELGAVLLNRDGRLIASCSNTETRNHVASINTVIQSVLDSGGVSFHQLEKVVVCAGPGSYTGLRIGLAVAKGICYATNLPLVLHNKLFIIARQTWSRYQNTGYQLFGVSLLARPQEYFTAWYDVEFNPIVEPTHLSERELFAFLNNQNNLYWASDSIPTTLEGLQQPPNRIVPDLTIDPDFWCKMAFEPLNCNNNVKISIAEPFYLKQVYTHN